MAILPIRLYPDPVLREPAAAVGQVDDDVRKLVADMAETMLDALGIGLAAPQVGVQRRVLVYRVDEESELRALIDPVITSSDGEIIDDEGCLSIPGLAFPVARAERIAVRGIDAMGSDVVYETTDLEARVIQHEVDHLDGILFIDRLDPEHRREAMREIREMTLSGARPSERPAL